ncbi:MAG: transcriptional regulator [Subdoligranulum sp.]|nr:transcriptional regulator [Subdoligranulum sp.]
MKKLQDEAQLFRQLLTLLETAFGKNCEVVLHDLTGSYEHSIIDIRNGHITNRQIGGCGSNLGLEVLSGSVVDGDRFNYITHTEDGRTLRSSSIYLKDPDGKVIGSLCVNLDITETLRFDEFLRSYNQYDAVQSEFFAPDVGSLLEYLIRQAQSAVGKPPCELNREERLRFLQYLDEKGAFQISKSSVHVCEVLGISKFTLYSDLEIIRTRNGGLEGKP